MKKIALILVIIIILGTAFISGCVQNQSTQNKPSNNTTLNNSNNTTEESPEQTLGGESKENKNSTG